MCTPTRDLFALQCVWKKADFLVSYGLLLGRYNCGCSGKEYDCVALGEKYSYVCSTCFSSLLYACRSLLTYDLQRALEEAEFTVFAM